MPYYNVVFHRGDNKIGNGIFPADELWPLTGAVPNGVTVNVECVPTPITTIDEESRGYRNMKSADIDVMRPNGRHGPLRWKFHLLFEKELTQRGIDGYGNRACGSAAAAILSDPPQKTEYHTFVCIGDVITTDCGDYRVEWFKSHGFVNHDHLTLVPVMKELE